MWFMNKIINPVMRLILRSPLHGLLSGSLLLLTYRGRKSGRVYSLPVQYFPDGNTLYLMPGSPEKKTWWRNLLGGAAVRVTLRGQTLEGKGVLLDLESDREKTLKGLGQYLRRFPSLAASKGVRFEKDGSLNLEDLQRAASSFKVVCVELE